MSTGTAKLSELQEIPFLAKDIDAWRMLSSTSFFVNDEWHFWFPFPDGLRKLAARPSEGNYFGDKSERVDDLRLPYLEFMAQHIMCQPVAFFARGIENDFHSLAASLGKFKLFYRESKRDRAEVRRFVETEVEYILMVCRSMFDLLQELISTMLGLTVTLEGKKGRSGQLPKSFAKMIERGGQPMARDEIQSVHDISPRFADWYASHGDFFLRIRRLRDGLVHSGQSVPKTLYVLDRGFAVPRDNPTFEDFYAWPNECEAPNGLVPLRPVIGLVIAYTLGAFYSFAHVFGTEVRLPGQIAPGLGYYMRGFHNRELLELRDVIERALWDEDEAQLGSPPTEPLDDSTKRPETRP
ncbi:MAG: hypothetical protein ACJ8C4_15115 [Gemmataceae bacterium]